MGTGFSHGRTTCFTLLTAVIIAAYGLSCGGDKGDGPTGVGAVRGTVRLPFDLTADFQPVAGAVVRLSGGDYDESVTSDVSGSFSFGDVPARQMTLSTSYGLCKATSSEQIDVIDGDTTQQDLVLSPVDSDDCIELPYAGASRVAIDETSNTAVLLYDTQVQSVPSLVTVDLATGQGIQVEFSDLDNVYDIRLINSSLAVINCKSGPAYGLRFIDLTTGMQDGTDVIYNTESSSFPGRLALDPSHETVFITHAVFASFQFRGRVYAVSVAGRSLIDADLNDADGLPAFDSELISGSIEYAYNIAFDPDGGISGEILVGNQSDKYLTAIDWSRWGLFDRSAGLSVPATGVRIIGMDPGATTFEVSYWDFADGHGVAAQKSSPVIALLYESGEDTYSESITEANRDFRSDQHILKIVPARQSWFTIGFDPDRPFEYQRRAVEERDWTTLGRLARFETRFREDPSVKARSFGVNATTGRLYVAYSEHPVLEVFDLDVPAF